jgi:hypothetical protein
MSNRKLVKPCAANDRVSVTKKRCGPTWWFRPTFQVRIAGAFLILRAFGSTKIPRSEPEGPNEMIFSVYVTR